MPLLFDDGLQLAVDDFRLIRDAVKAFCGIRFDDGARFMVERRLRERVHALGLDGFDRYYQYLRYHPAAASELEHAVELLTTNETYFFREDYQLTAFREEVLPLLAERLRASAAARLALWSAGCSTGEEVYTLAMIVDSSGLFEDRQVRIFGNDISRRVLQVARRAIYGPSSFRVMPGEYARYFVDTPRGKQVHPRIRAMCSFGHINLVASEQTAIVGQVDVVFCRNVLIYFDDQSRKNVIGAFYDCLSPGGYLFLGHSESLLNVSTAFELVHLKSDLVYRRPTDSAATLTEGQCR